MAITAGAQAKAGTEGVSAGMSAGPATGVQAETHYTKGMAVFVHTKGGLMYEAAIGGQKFSYTPPLIYKGIQKPCPKLRAGLFILATFV